MIDDALRAAAKRVLDSFRARGLKVATAESCTGGLVAAALTEIAGSSDVVDCGFVTYSNAAKQAMLGVPEATLKRHGAVSAQTAAAMAAGALKNSHADVAVAITGIAGPGGGTKAKSPSALSISPRPAVTGPAGAHAALRQNRTAPRAAALGCRSA